MRKHFVGLCALTCVLAAPQAAMAAEALVGVDDSGRLVELRSDKPQFVVVRDIDGLPAGVRLLGIDTRPANGRVYGVGSDSRLYIADLARAAFVPFGGPFSPAVSGTAFGFDFNPVVDRIRLTSDAEQNLRLNPDTGAVAAGDGSLKYGEGDPGAGQDPNVVASAYTNNVAGTGSTQLLNIDSGRDTLVLQDPPNAGGLKTVGALGIDVTDAAGFDIAGSDGTAWAALRTGSASSSELHRIDLATGRATPVGRIGGGRTLVALTAVGTAPPDTKPPGVSVAISASRRISTLASRGVAAAVSLTEGATIRATLKLGRSTLASSAAEADLASTVPLRLVPSRAAARRIRARDSVRLKARITVTDAAGNVTVVQRVVKAG